MHPERRRAERPTSSAFDVHTSFGPPRTKTRAPGDHLDRLEIRGKLVHIDNRSAHHPSHLGESCVASVVVGQVLQVTSGGIEAKAATR